MPRVFLYSGKCQQRVSVDAKVAGAGTSADQADDQSDEQSADRSNASLAHQAEAGHGADRREQQRRADNLGNDDRIGTIEALVGVRLDSVGMIGSGHALQFRLGPSNLETAALAGAALVLGFVIGYQVATVRMFRTLRSLGAKLGAVRHA